jgi:hypothetical protein
MRPEFLILPLLAYASLLFISKAIKQESKLLLFFALLGLLGSFLAKGANDPFGFIYLWMFDHIPGFVTAADKSEVLIIFTPAVPATHIQKNYFIQNGYTLVKRSDVLGELAAEGKCIAVAVTHGKITTTT